MEKIADYMIIHLSFVFLIFLFDFSGSEKKFSFYEDTSKMREEILLFIPIGSDIHKGKEIMEKNRFNCEWRENSDFAVSEKFYSGIDYLYCDRKKSGLFITKRWQVAILYKAGKVTEVVVSYGLIGL